MAADATHPLTALQARLAEIDAERQRLNDEKAETVATFRVKIDALDIEAKRIEKALRALNGSHARGAR